MRQRSLGDILLAIAREHSCPICGRTIEPVYRTEGVCELCFSDRAERYKAPSAYCPRRGIPITK
jgi:NMD protein affecting ribosome stability and mRNA decay